MGLGGETKETHNYNYIVEIPVEQEEEMGKAMTRAMEQHPMMEISQSPGHLLLLKLWQREEALFARRISLKETRLDSIRTEIFQLCCCFLLFHGFSFTLLFLSSSSSSDDDHLMMIMRCKKWWVPSILIMAASIAVAGLVQMKLVRYRKVAGEVQREKGDNRAVSRCIQELRMKGGSFDLSKDPNCNKKKKMKSSSVEIKWKPVSWCSQYLVTLCLLVLAALAFPAPKLFLCF